MSKINLKESAVVFSAADHQYTLDGRTLSGVTPIVKWMYPETYKDIPESILESARERGTNVHLDCQMADAGFDVSSPEAEAYVRMKTERGLETLKNEWLVDDGHDIASSIDVVYTDYSIADIKATSKIHYDNVTLQLSIYAWLLEKMNPGLQVPAMYVIWLPREQYGAPSMTQLQRIDAGVCEKVVAMYLNGESNEEARKLIGADDPVMLADLKHLEEEYCFLYNYCESIKKRLEEIKSSMQEAIQGAGVKTYSGDQLSATWIEGKDATKLDTAALKKLHPDVYAECSKQEKTKSYLQVKLKTKKQ